MEILQFALGQDIIWAILKNVSRVSITKTSVCLKVKTLAFEKEATWLEIGTFAFKKNERLFKSFAFSQNSATIEFYARKYMMCGFSLILI